MLVNMNISKILIFFISLVNSSVIVKTRDRGRQSEIKGERQREIKKDSKTDMQYTAIGKCNNNKIMYHKSCSEHHTEPRQ